MSRHVKTHPNNPRKHLIYGYDRVLSQYFWQEWEAGDGSPTESSDIHGANNKGMLEKMSEYGISDKSEHFQMVALDLPIGDEPNPNPILGYEEAVLSTIEDDYEMTRSDAQGMLMVKPEVVADSFEKNLSPQACAELVM